MPASVLLALTTASGCGTTVPHADVVQQQSEGALGTAGSSGGAGSTPGNSTGLSGPATLPGTAGGTASGGSGPSAVVGQAGNAATVGTAPTSGSGTKSQRQPAHSVPTGPISVGFVVGDYTKSAAAVGFAGGAVSDPQQYFRWLVKDYNAHGGLAGRKIAPVYATVDGASSNYDTASQVACSAFTQDNHVSLALSNLWVNPTLTACLLRAGIPQFEGTSEVLNDEHMLAQSPNLIVPAGMATDREATAVIAQSVRLGWLTPKDKLGILYDSCPYNARAVSEAAVPVAHHYGIPVDPIDAFDCGSGFADVGSFSAGVQNAELRMHSDRVTKIMFLTQGENGSMVFFSNDAQSQAWHPTYLASSNALMTSTESQGEMQPSQMANVRGIGWYPLLDEDRPPVTPAMRACQRSIVGGGGQVPASLNDQLTMYAACNAMTMAEAALRASGGAGGLPALQPAVERLGTSYSSVVTLADRTRFGPGRHDGADLVAPFSYQATCKCFRYVGAPRPWS